MALITVKGTKVGRNLAKPKKSVTMKKGGDMSNIRKSAY